MAASTSLLHEGHDLLVTRASSPQELAQRQAALVRTHLPFIWRLLKRLGLSPEDADDAAQEVFLIAVAKLDQIETGQERRFLAGIALRIASRARRSQKRRTDKTVLAEIDQCHSPVPGSDELLARKEARALLDEAMAEMSPDVRTAFVLYELEQMTMIEISTLTDAPAGTVASRIRRAREQFQAAVARFQKVRRR